jgi:hypothetical protein
MKQTAEKFTGGPKRLKIWALFEAIQTLPNILFFLEEFIKLSVMPFTHLIDFSQLLVHLV